MKVPNRVFALLTAGWASLFFCGASLRVLADCGSFGLPFTDLGTESTFCAAIAEAYYAGITNGTTPTTFSPNANVTRVQAAAFATRTLDAALTRGSRRAALGQWWTTNSYDSGLGIVSLGSLANGPPQSDGADLWIPFNNIQATSNSVARVRASDGKLVETWTGATGAYAVLVAMGRVFVTGESSLYMIDPSQPAGDVTAVAPIPGAGVIAFDGSRIWTTYISSPTQGSLSIITPGPTLPWSVTTVATGFPSPGILFDGHNIWISNVTGGSVQKLDGEGNSMLSVALPPTPLGLTFDGKNLWVTNGGPNAGSVSVVRASDGLVLKTLTGNGLHSPFPIGFDGKRILVANYPATLSVFDATSLEPIGLVPVPSAGVPSGVCSDGINFWIAFQFSTVSLARF